MWGGIIVVMSFVPLLLRTDIYACLVLRLEIGVLG